MNKIRIYVHNVWINLLKCLSISWNNSELVFCEAWGWIKKTQSRPSISPRLRKVSRKTLRIRFLSWAFPTFLEMETPSLPSLTGDSFRTKTVKREHRDFFPRSKINLNSEEARILLFFGNDCLCMTPFRAVWFLKEEQDYFFETFTVRRLRPLVRRRLRTFLPDWFFIRFRKPCLRFALILLGWKVLFMTRLPPNFSLKRAVFVECGFEKSSLFHFVNAKRFAFSPFKFFFQNCLANFFWTARNSSRCWSTF